MSEEAVETLSVTKAEPAGDGKRTDPRGFILKALENLRSAVLPLALVIFTRIDDGMGAVMAVSLIVGGGALLLSGVAAYLQWTKLTYRVGDTDIRVESGLLSRKARSVPFERIQDVSSKQGFLARQLGLVELTFDTGAGEGEDISLAYLREEEAARLRALARDKRDAAAPVGDAREDLDEASQLLFAMSPARVLTYGLFNFSLVIIGVTGGLLAQYDDLLPFDLWDIEGWQERLAGPGAWLAGLGVVAQAIGVVALLAVLGFFGLATGVVRTALSQWGFRLERTEKGFRRQRGLLTRTDVTLPVRRVQAAIVSARGRERLFGWQGASLVSLAADAGASNHEIAPFARPDEVDPLIEEARLRMPHGDLDWHGISRIHAILSGLGRLRFWWLGAAALLAFQVYGDPPDLLSARWLILVPIVIGAWKATRTTLTLWRLRYALDDRQIYVVSGWLSRMLELVPREKLQSVSIGQGPIARLFGFAWLHLGVAGTQAGVPGVAIERAHVLRDRLVPDMLARDFSRLN